MIRKYLADSPRWRSNPFCGAKHCLTVFHPNKSQMDRSTTSRWPSFWVGRLSTISQQKLNTQAYWQTQLTSDPKFNLMLMCSSRKSERLYLFCDTILPPSDVLWTECSLYVYLTHSEQFHLRFVLIIHNNKYPLLPALYLLPPCDKLLMISPDRLLQRSIFGDCFVNIICYLVVDISVTCFYQ